MNDILAGSSQDMKDRTRALTAFVSGRDWKMYNERNYQV